MFVILKQYQRMVKLVGTQRPVRCNKNVMMMILQQSMTMMTSMKLVLIMTLMMIALLLLMMVMVLMMIELIEAAVRH